MAKSCRIVFAFFFFFKECSLKVQYSEANTLIIMLLLLAAKCSDTIYAFCKVGILVWVQSDNVRGDGQGTRTHFPSVATPQSSSVVSSQLQVITVLLRVSHSDFYFDKHWHLFCFSFPLGHFLPLLASRHSLFPHPDSLLPEMSDVYAISFGTWEFGGIFWYYRAAFLSYLVISCYTTTATI